MPSQLFGFNLAEGTATTLSDGLLRPKHVIGLPCPWPFYMSFLNILDTALKTTALRTTESTECLIGND
jgi:hypothetical protein